MTTFSKCNPKILEEAINNIVTNNDVCPKNILKAIRDEYENVIGKQANRKIIAASAGKDAYYDQNKRIVPCNACHSGWIYEINDPNPSKRTMVRCPCMAKLIETEKMMPKKEKAKSYGY